MDPLESRRIAVSLERLAGRGADSAGVVEAIVSVWRVVEAELSPIIGSKGVAALYWRSLYLVRARYPWLGAIQGAESPMDFSQLRAVLHQQGSSQAAAAGGAHLQAVYELLGSLIGASLTAQLLGPVWDKPFDGAAAQDVST